MACDTGSVTGNHQGYIALHVEVVLILLLLRVPAMLNTPVIHIMHGGSRSGRDRL